MQRYTQKYYNKNRRKKPTLEFLWPCLVLSCLIHAVAGRTFPAGERGSAAGSLLSSHCPNYTWACVLCRPSPELPFHFVWFLGWSTWHLALDPSSVLYLQHKLCSYLDALQHLPPPQPVPRQLLPLRHITSSQLKLLGGHIQRSGRPISHTKPADIAHQTPKRKEEVENKTIFRPS